MDRTTDRQPYRPPQITRVVLRMEQAILSQCSTSANDPRDFPDGFKCAKLGDDCKSWASEGENADDGARPS